jgi:rSAM/selenodomain-associated transferase 2
VRISVVIPALNEAANISRAVKSAWSARADEVLVVDGGSQDQTVDVAAGEDATVLVGAAGRSVQQNLGAQQATGDVLLFQHADNRLDNGACEQIRSRLRDERVVCGAFRQRIEATGWRYRLLEFGNAQRVVWCGLPYGDQAIFVRKAIFEQLGGFPEVPLMEDLMLMRQVRRRWRPVLLDGPVYISARRWKEYGVIRQTARNWCLVAAYTLGVPPERLAKHYARHDERGAEE